ncbi:hypothetical protein C7999DRAFT_16923 [Corynascus novoguineensis]|uniref:Uncharacterized protein n=1 Tax=Corynascus novoguineensis TaxID=1126955 RepID=A0AAN7CMM1_9PEZI|nr:hypothetical protein C7999DRAFT_16923 [Corynascus novoguineensis]
MAPPCPNFPVRHLSTAAQVNEDGKMRKTDGGRRIDLARDCELFGLVQYECIVRHPELADSPVQCWPVQRWFRRCQDKKGSFTAETTAWEGTASAITPTESAPSEGQGVHKSATTLQTAAKSSKSV